MKKGLVLTALLIVPVLAFSQPVQWDVNSTATWIEVVGGIRGAGNNRQHTVTVTGNFNVPPTVGEENIFGNVTGVTVTLEGNGSFTLSGNGIMLRIGSGQTLVVRDIALRGREGNNNMVVVIGDRGNFRMEGSASVSGHIGSRIPGGGMYLGGGVYINNGTFTMQDNASVFGNRGSSGVLVNGGTFTMRDNSSVSGNTGITARGEGVWIDGGATFTMRDNSSISGNPRGGVVVEHGTFNMHGGTISGNTVRIGDETRWTNIGTFNMYGGTISESGVNITINGRFTMQEGTISGGVRGVNITGNGRFTMQGGTISGNSWRGVHVGDGPLGRDTATFTMQSGTIYGNGGGVHVDRFGGTFAKTGGTIYGNDASDPARRNISPSNQGHAVFNTNGNWRNATAGPAMNSDTFGFWLNETN